MLRSGSVLGEKYRLVAPIGRGGMGSVWRAEHVTLGRAVAVKLVLDDENPDTIARFLREARVAAQIRHRHVVAITDVGTEEGQPYIVMELLEGESLQARMARAPRIEVPELVEIVSGALSGLEAVHAVGIVHRDIKPANIFLVREVDGMVPKLVDFGTSRAAVAAATGTRPGESSGDTITQVGMIVGTPHYMSSEQVRGLRDLDGRSDLYSMGVVLYEALAGVLPYDDVDFHSLIVNIATRDHDSLSAHRPDLPDALLSVVDRATSRDRAHRFATAREMRQALLATLQAPTRPVPLPPTAVHVVPASFADAMAPTMELPPEPVTDPVTAVAGDPRAFVAQAVTLIADPATIVAEPVTLVAAPPAVSPVAPEEQVAVPAQRRARARAWPLVALAGLVLLAVGAGVAFGLPAWLSPAAAPELRVTMSPAPVTSPSPSPAPVTSPSPSPSPSPRASPSPVVAPADPQQVEVTLRDLPTGASIRVEGETLSGPVLRLPRDGVARHIEVRVPMRLPWAVTHDCSSDGDYVVELPPGGTTATAASQRLRFPRAVVSPPASPPSSPASPSTLLGDPGF